MTLIIHNGRRIRVEEAWSPHPAPLFQAVDDDTYEGGEPIGTGSSAEEAIADLEEQLEWQAERRDPDRLREDRREF